MNPLYIIIVILLVLALAGLPSVGFFPNSYGYYPSGTLGLIILILLILVLTR